MKLVRITLIALLLTLSTALTLFSAPASAALPPSPTEGVDLINGPEDNPRDRYGWHGKRFAIPDYIILMCENRRADYGLRIIGFHPTRRTASGLYMITKGTWNGFAGYTYAYQAPPYLQDQKAAMLWANGRGKTHWKSCL